MFEMNMKIGIIIWILPLQAGTFEQIRAAGAIFTPNIFFGSNTVFVDTSTVSNRSLLYSDGVPCMHRFLRFIDWTSLTHTHRILFMRFLHSHMFLRVGNVDRCYRISYQLELLKLVLFFFHHIVCGSLCYDIFVSYGFVQISRLLRL